MRREDWPVLALLAEAVSIILEIAYIGLQIFYGITYHISPYTLILNLAVGILVYAGLTILALYPEYINRIPVEECVGQVRLLSMRMVRVIKLIFVVGLIVPCLFDVFGLYMPNAYNVVVMGLIFIVGVYYETKIIQILRGRGK